VSRTQDAALLFARLLIAALILPNGINKLLHFSKFAASLSGKGVPFAKIVAILNVAVEVVGAIALIIGLWPLLTALALLALTFVTTWTTYRFGIFGAVFRQPQLFYAVSGPGAWSRTSLFRA
jgi:putative oxidoreductase